MALIPLGASEESFSENLLVVNKVDKLAKYLPARQ